MPSAKKNAFEIEEELRNDPEVAKATAGRVRRATHKVEAEELIEILSGDDASAPGPRTATRGSAPTKTAATAALNAIDQDATFDAAKETITWEIYDGTQSINGMSPAAFEAHMRSRGDWPEDGSIILGYEKGQLSVIQPHPPAVQGMKAMSDAEARKIAQAQLHDGYILDRKANEIIPLAEVAAESDPATDQLLAAVEDPLEPDVYEVSGMAQDRARTAIINAARLKLQKG